MHISIPFNNSCNYQLLKYSERSQNKNIYKKLNFSMLHIDSCPNLRVTHIKWQRKKNQKMTKWKKLKSN